MSLALKIDLVKDARLRGPQFTTPGPVVRHLGQAGYHVTCGVSPDLMEASRMAAMQMIDLLCRRHNLSAMDAYLLCNVCADLVINELVNKPVHVVSLYFRAWCWSRPLVNRLALRESLVDSIIFRCPVGRRQSSY